MQQENLEVLRAYWDAMAAGERERAMSYYHDDCVLEMPGTHRGSGRHEGHEGVKRFVLAMGELTGGTFRLVPKDLLASDDHAITFADVHAEVNGRSMDWDRVIVSTVRDGKLAHMRVFEADQAAVNEFLNSGQ